MIGDRRQMETEILLANMTHTLQIIGCQFGVKSPYWSYPRHHHHLFELLYCWEGEVTQSAEDHEFTLNAGDLLLLKPGIKHHTYNHSTKPYSFINIHFNIDDKELRRLLTANAYEHMNKEMVQQTRLTAYLQEIETVLQSELQSSDNQGWNGNLISLHLTGLNKLWFQSLVLFMIKEVVVLLNSSKPVISKIESHNSTLQVDIAHAMEAMLQDKSYTKGAITDIAKKQNLSRSHCYKIFTQVYGMSPRQYLTQIKLNHAKQLLLDSELTIEAISTELGFASLSHFSRQFRRWTGVSPYQYRPKH